MINSKYLIMISGASRLSAFSHDDKSITIRQCAVIVREDTPGDKQLVAYFETRKTPAPTATDLRAYLELDLPIYMAPRSSWPCRSCR
jgi:hypothetical protein